MTEADAETLKQYQKIWVTFIKYIKNQCNQNKITDSSYFGTFYREGDSYLIQSKKVNEFTKKNSDSNTSSGAEKQDLEKLDSVSINFQVIANVIGTTNE